MFNSGMQTIGNVPDMKLKCPKQNEQELLLPPRLTPFEVLQNDLDGRTRFTLLKDEFLRCCLDQYERAIHLLESATSNSSEEPAWVLVQRQRRVALNHSFELACRAVHSLETSIAESADFTLFMNRF